MISGTLNADAVASVLAWTLVLTATNTVILVGILAFVWIRRRVVP
jgi:hypothetical protein